MLFRRSNIRHEFSKCVGTFFGSEASEYLGFHFYHPDISLKLIIVKRHMKVFSKQADTALVFCQTLHQCAKLTFCLTPAFPCLLFLYRIHLPGYNGVIYSLPASTLRNLFQSSINIVFSCATRPFYAFPNVFILLFRPENCLVFRMLVLRSNVIY